MSSDLCKKAWCQGTAETSGSRLDLRRVRHVKSYEEATIISFAAVSCFQPALLIVITYRVASTSEARYKHMTASPHAYQIGADT